MTFAQLLTRIHGAWLMLTGRVALPEVPLGNMEVQMAWDKVQASVNELEAALTRAGGDKTTAASALSTAEGQVTDLTTQLGAAEDQIVALLQPAVDAANQLSPPPATGA